MKLEFEGLLNARDLGGICGYEGRAIKMGRLIRSDNLSPITNNDAEHFISLGLKAVVDFRTNEEISASPDKEIQGVKYISNPILKSLTTGVTREERKKPQCLAELLLDFSLELEGKGKEWLAGLYEPLVSDEFSLNGYRRFLEYLRENRSGAVLFHCSAGKDRVGIGTLIVLSALGVSRQDIIKDYLLTNESYAKVIAQAYELGMSRGIEKSILDTIQPLSGVDVSYIERAFKVIDEAYGGTSLFLKNALGLDEDFIEDLRNNYLE